MVWRTRISQMHIPKLTKVYCRARFECLVIWLFICSDIIDCLFIGTSFGIGCYFTTMKRYDQQFILFDFLSGVLKCVVFNLFYLLPFSVSNQMPKQMILEDKINKPYRPLPSKIITISQAQSRFYIYTIFYVVISWYQNCLFSCVVWMSFMWMYNQKNWSRFWFFKNLVMSIGAISLFSGQWSVISMHINNTYKFNTGCTGTTSMMGIKGATDLNISIMRWIFIESFCIGLGISMQDIRDMKGDKMTGRVTLPILLNDKIGCFYTRVVFCLINVVVIPSIIFLSLYDLKFVNWDQIVCAMYLMLHQVYVGFRLFRCYHIKIRNNNYVHGNISKCINDIDDDDETIGIAKEDDKTYQLWAIWFIILHFTCCCVIGKASS